MSLPSSLSAPPYSDTRNDRNVLSHSAPAGIQQRRTFGEYLNDIIYIILCSPYVFAGRAQSLPSKVHRGCSTNAPRAGSGRPSSFEPASDWCFFQLPYAQCLLYPHNIILLYYPSCCCASQCEKKIIFP